MRASDSRSGCGVSRFLPYARNIITGVDRAITAIRPGSRALRIDVLGLRSAQAVVLHDYWRSHPETDLDVVTLKVNDPRVAVTAVQAGDIDASFRSVTDPATLPRDVQMIHAFDSPLELLVGPRHPLAPARTLTPSQLRQHRIWVPGIAPRSEWAEFYDQLATDFDLRIDAAGPNFGNEVLLDILADSADVATLVGSRDRYIWPTWPSSVSSTPRAVRVNNRTSSSRSRVAIRFDTACCVTPSSSAACCSCPSSAARTNDRTASVCIDPAYMCPTDGCGSPWSRLFDPATVRPV